MQKLLLGITICVVGWFAVPSVSAQEPDLDGALDEYAYRAEQIDYFDVELNVHEDGSMSVVETIDYNFGSTDRHGIIRLIPRTVTIAEPSETDHASAQSNERPVAKKRLSIADIRVTDEEGTPYPMNVSTSSSVTEIIIGDEDIYLSGVHTYVISYTVLWPIRYFETFDELYWNAIGTEWEVPIMAARVGVAVPGSVRSHTCYLGAYGATERCSADARGRGRSGDTIITFTVPRILQAGEGVTVAVSVPSGAIAAPTELQRIWWRFADVWYLPLPLLVVYWWFRKKLRYVRERRAFYQRNTIIPEYDPGDFDPLETAVLYRGYISTTDLSANIIALAVRGFITIRKVDDEYAFAATNKDPSGLSSYDRDLLAGIAGKSQTELKNVFHSTAQKIIASATESVHKRNYTVSKRTMTGNATPRSVAIFLGLFLAINPGIFVWFIAGTAAGYTFSTSSVLIALVYAIFNPRTNGLTEKGLQAERKMLGLRQYIDVAETDRIKFHNAPEKNPDLFEKLLPYAMIFGLEKQWAGQFATIYRSPPQWYTDSAHPAFSASVFTSDLRSFSRSTGKTLFSSPNRSSSGSSSGSSGGGFSGGGSGGGGGRSW